MASQLRPIHRESSNCADHVIARLPSVRSTVAWTKLPDGAVLFSPETEVYYAINGVAALNWEHLSQTGDSVAALCAAVSERYPGTPTEQIRVDVVDFLGDLERSGLVESSPAESARD